MANYEDTVNRGSCLALCTGSHRGATPVDRLHATPFRTVETHGGTGLVLSRDGNGIAVDQHGSFVNVGERHGDWVAERQYKYVGNGQGQFTPVPEAPPGGYRDTRPARTPGPQMCMPLWAGLLCLSVSIGAVWLLVPETNGRLRTRIKKDAPEAITDLETPSQHDDLASVVSASLKKQVGPGPYQRFDATLDHSKGEMFGFRLSSEFNSLYLTSVDSMDGLVANWNKKHPERDVRVGDRIIDVNGVHGSSIRLLEEVNKFKSAELKVLRVTEGRLQQAQPVQFYEIFLDRTKGKVFGADVVKDDSSLIVKKIYGGLVSKWNRANPKAIVYPGDRIISVNHIDGKAHKLLDECNNLRVLEIRLVRGEGAYQKQVHEDIETMSQAPWGRPWGEDEEEQEEERFSTSWKHVIVVTETRTWTTVTGTTTTATLTGTSTTLTRTSTATATATITDSTTVTTRTSTSTTRTTTTTLREYVRGLKAEFFYHIDQIPGLAILPVNRQKIMQVVAREPDLVRIDPQVYYPLTLYGWPGVNAQEFFVARWSGQLVIKKGGKYMFQLKSDDGSAMLLDGKPLHSAQGAHSSDRYIEHPWQATPETEADLDPGGHDILVTYFNIRLHAGIIAMYRGPDTKGQLVAIPAYALRTRSAELPPSLLENAIYLEGVVGSEHISGGNVFQTVGHRLLASVFLVAVLGTFATVGWKTCRKRQENRNYGDLRQIMGESDRPSHRRQLQRVDAPAG